jgi:KipI family sensor histidine kinase inhibitor
VEIRRIRRAGRHGLLVEVDDPLAVLGALERMRRAGALTAREIVPGATTVLLDGVTDPERLQHTLETGPPPSPESAVGRPDPTPKTIKIPIWYAGADLPFVANHWGISPQATVERLSDIRFTVAFCGFAPGFAYLRGLPADWAVPRLDSPRTKVPAGSVALAGEFAGIYPTASPGGWRLIGHTDAALFDVHRDPPALLTPGTRVRLVPQ